MFLPFEFTNDTVILTPNRRLSRYLSRKLNAELKEKKSAWLSPNIFPYHVWLEILLKKYSAVVLLSEHQEHALWDSIIKSETSAVIGLVKQAWEIVKQWQISLSELSDYSDETKAFYNWLQDFQAICNSKNLCDKNTVPEIIMDGVQQGRIKLPARLCLVGFDNIYPQQQKLFQIFSQSVEIAYQDINCLAANEQCIACVDVTTEMMNMAHWAHKTLATNPHAYIGCVIPNLVQIRAEIERIFTKTFCNFTSKPFNISVGKTLDQFPIIGTALKILELNDGLTTINIDYLLNSPFVVGAADEKKSRAEFRSQLKLLNLDQITLEIVLAHSKCPIFTQLLCKIPNIRNITKTPSNWVQFFILILERFGLGKNLLNDEECQVLQHFYKLLHKLASLDLVIHEISYTQVLIYFNNMVRRTIFQTPNEQQPIDILGVLEASGINFDHLWIMSMDNHTWPPSPSPNPFIPLALQKKFNLPHASHERELDFCEKIIKRFTHSSKSIIYSYPLCVDDRSCRLSLMIKQALPITLQDLQLDVAIMPEPLQKKTELFVEEPFFPINSTEKIHGGSKIFELQALCPFRAFATLRLTAYQKPAWRNIMRGVLVHAILEEIWKNINSYQNLLQYSDILLQELVGFCIDNTVEKHSRDFIGISDFLIEVEKKCLNQLILKWMQLEKSRLPFEIVSLEKKCEVCFGDLKLKLRIDRIDRLADGTIMIIDYKTSKQPLSTAGWFNENLTNSQLPLYCMVSEEEIGAIAFAQLKADAVEFKGISQKDIGIEGIDETPEWSELLVKWRTNLTQLSKDFCAGKALIDPKNNACRMCELKILCKHTVNT